MTKVPGFKHTELPKEKSHLKLYAHQMEKSLDQKKFSGEKRDRAIHLLQTARKELKKSS